VGLLVCVSAAYTGLAGLPALAIAQAPPECPAAPAAYSGSDEVVAELRALRDEQRTSCLATLARLDTLDTDADATNAKLDAANAELAAHGDQLAELVVNTEPEAQPANGSEDVVAAVDAAQLELDAALWFLAGLLCALAASWLFAREVLGGS
jgi:hypothetical protein